MSIFELKDVEALVKKVLTEVFPLDKEGYVPAYAVLLTAVVKPTLYYDDVLTQKYKEERLASIAPVKVVIKKGEVIVTEGQKVTKEAYKKAKNTLGIPLR